MIRVFIADDFPQMIEVMQRLVGRAPDMAVVKVVTDFQQVLKHAREMDYEVILMNDYIPPTSSVMASRRLRELGVTEPILIISMHRDAALVRDSLQAGANGFILKEEFGQHLLPAIRAVSAGEEYLSPTVRSLLEEE